MKRRPRHKRSVVSLTPDMREDLKRLIRGKSSKRDRIRAQVLLLADQSDDGPSETDVRIAVETGLSVRTIETLRKRFVEDGMAAAVAWRRKPFTREPAGADAPDPEGSASE